VSLFFLRLALNLKYVSKKQKPRFLIFAVLFSK